MLIFKGDLQVANESFELFRVHYRDYDYFDEVEERFLYRLDASANK